MPDHSLVSSLWPRRQKPLVAFVVMPNHSLVSSLWPRTWVRQFIVDFEIRSLAPEGGGSLGLMESFLQMIRLELKTGRNFEAVQSYLGLFLKMHGETVAEEEVLMRELEIVEESLGKQWSQLQHHLDSALCLTTFFKSSFL